MNKKTNSQEPQTLSTDKYTIEFSNAGTAIYALDDVGQKMWIATAADPEIAMGIVEGLILVEHKRFYHPEATPTFAMEKDPNVAETSTTEKEILVEEIGNNLTPPFLKKTRQAS